MSFHVYLLFVPILQKFPILYPLFIYLLESMLFIILADKTINLYSEVIKFCHLRWKYFFPFNFAFSTSFILIDSMRQKPSFICSH